MIRKPVCKEVLVQFVDSKDEPIGPHTIVPLKIAKQDLDDLINSFTGGLNDANPDHVASVENYSYLVNDELPVYSTLWETVRSKKLGTENVVVIKCIPVSAYRIKPINICCATLPGHQNSILSVAFSPNSLLLATGAGDNMVRLWDTQTKTPIKTISYHKNWVMCVLFSPDNKYIASASMDGDVVVHDSETGALIKEMKSRHKLEVTTLCFEPLHLLQNEDIQTTKKNRKIPNFEKNKKGLLATAVKVEDLDDIHLANYNTMNLAKKLTMEENDDMLKLPKIVRWVGSSESTTPEDMKTTAKNLHLQKNEYLQEEAEIPSSSSIQQQKQQRKKQNPFTEKDKILSEDSSNKKAKNEIFYLKNRLASAGNDAIIRICDLFCQGEDIVLTGHNGPITRIIWAGKNRKNSYIYSCSRDKTIKVWSVYKKVLIYDFKHHNHWINWMSLNTEQLIKNGMYDLDFIINKMDITNSIEKAKKIYDKFLISEKCEKIVSCSEDGVIYLIHHLKNTFTHMKLLGHGKAVIHVNFSPNGKLFASASFDKTIRIWCATHGDCLAVFRGHVSAVYRTAWCIDNKILASCSEDSTVKIWDVSPYQKIKHEAERDLLDNLVRSEDVVDESTSDENAKRNNTKKYAKTAAKQDEKVNDKAGVTTDGKANEKACEKTVEKTNKTVVNRSKTTVKTIEKKIEKTNTKKNAKTDLKKNTMRDLKKNAETDIKKNVKADTEKDGTNIHADNTNKNENSVTKTEKKKKTALVDLPGHEAAVYAIDWSNDGKYVASGGKDKMLKIWSH